MNHIAKKILTFVIFGTFVVCDLNVAFAQTGYLSARNLSLGGGGTAYMTGFEAAFINPANIGLFNGNNQFMLGIPGDLSFKTGGSLANITAYNKYFTKGYTFDGTNGPSIDQVLNDWFGSSDNKMKSVGVNFNLVPLAYVHKSGKTAYGLSLRFRTLADISMNKGMAGLILAGVDSSLFTGGRPVNFNETSYSTVELAFSYSRKLNLMGFLPKNQAIYVGVTPKLIGGLAYSSANLQSNLQIWGDTLLQHQFNYTIKTAGPISNDFQKFYQQRIDTNQTPDFNDFKPQDMIRGGLKGTGFGLDIGATYVYNFDSSYQPYSSPTHGKFLTISVSVTDIGSVTFKKDAGEFLASNTFTWSGLKPNYQEINAKYGGSFSNYMKHVLRDSVGKNIYGGFAPGKVSKIRVGLPTAIHFGAYLKYGMIGFSFDTGKGMNNYGMNSTQGYMATGLEFYFLPFLPLRFGYLTGGKTSKSFSFGTGLEFRFFQLSVGAMTLNNSQSNGYNLSTAVSMKLIF